MKSLYSPCTLPWTSLIPQQFLPAWFSVFSILTAQPPSPSLNPFPGTWSSQWILSVFPKGKLYPSIKLTSSASGGTYFLLLVSPDRWGLCYAWQPSQKSISKDTTIICDCPQACLWVYHTDHWCSLYTCCCCWIQVFVELFNIAISFPFSWLNTSRPFFCWEKRMW